jgi:hypothetical protein
MDILYHSDKVKLNNVPTSFVKMGKEAIRTEGLVIRHLENKSLYFFFPDGMV